MTQLALDDGQLRVSAASARLRFAGCEPGYIANVCHGACCRSGTIPMDQLITVQPWEEAGVVAHGGTVRGGCMATDGKRCGFQTPEDLCGLHTTGAKPFGCTVAPWCLSPRGTLIVHNRYKMLRCFKDGPQIPAYEAFRAGLVLVFGEAQVQALAAHLAAGGDDWWGTPLPRAYATLRWEAARRRSGRALPVVA